MSVAHCAASKRILQALCPCSDATMHEASAACCLHALCPKALGGVCSSETSNNGHAANCAVACRHRLSISRLVVQLSQGRAVPVPLLLLQLIGASSASILTHTCCYMSIALHQAGALPTYCHIVTLLC
eukprot:GHRR01013037.1.p1 GENE.GHRR01013037.1~~GHRR01013037.1.p1  ORF type:complete len:128 (-),score=36.50 GHRR01013037.1:516-899(-)